MDNRRPHLGSHHHFGAAEIAIATMIVLIVAVVLFAVALQLH